MAQVDDKIIKSIKELIAELQNDSIYISQAVLFGSYATGANHEFSDIDLALVSNNFDGIRFFDNMKLMRAVLKVNSNIETHPFTPEDFNSGNPLVAEIQRTGIQIL